MNNDDLDLRVSRLGECRNPSPVSGVRFISDEEQVLFHGEMREIKTFVDAGEKPPSFEMVGRTKMVVGYWKDEFTHVPISAAVSRRKQIEPDGKIWTRVLASTGQPREMR